MVFEILIVKMNYLSISVNFTTSLPACMLIYLLNILQKPFVMCQGIRINEVCNNFVSIIFDDLKRSGHIKETMLVVWRLQHIHYFGIKPFSFEHQ